MVKLHSSVPDFLESLMVSDSAEDHELKHQREDFLTRSSSTDKYAEVRFSPFYFQFCCFFE